MNIFERLIIVIFLLSVQTGVCFAQSGYGITTNPPIELILPVSCQLEENCWFVNYPDIDLTEGLKDYSNGIFTYNGNLGTEIAIQSLPQMQKGIPVVAAQDGTVIFTTNNVEDNLPLAQGTNVNNLPFCGNSVVIEHNPGWQTVYCHLKKGSVSVKKGDFVRKGNKIAEVGASGRAVFPHLYFAVLGDGACFDPFSGKQLSANEGTEGKTEMKQYKPFWSPVVKDKLTYREVAVVNVGVSTEDPTPDRIKEGEYQNVEIKTGIDSIVLWIYGFHFKKGDFIKAVLQNPTGARISYEMKTINNDEREKVVFFRVPKPAFGWRAGKYKGSFEVMRPGSKFVYEYSTSFEIKEPPVPVDEEAIRRKEQIYKTRVQKRRSVQVLKKLYEQERLPAQFKDREELIKRLKN
jgi:hypothetical protein